MFLPVTRHELVVLFYLLQGGTLHIPYEKNEIPKVSLEKYSDYLENFINDSMHYSSDKLFCRNERNGIYALSLLKQQKHIIKNYLQEYCSEMVKNTLPGFSTFHPFGWKYTTERFIKELEESNCNFKDFHTDSFYVLELLAPYLMKYDYKMNVRIDESVVNLTDTEYLDRFYFNMQFECSLDLSSILDKNDKKKKTKPYIEEPETRCKKFRPQQQKLFNFFERKAKSGKFSFAKYELNQFASIKNNALNSAISKLNMQYQEIYSTEEKLIEFDRGAGEYILNDIWGYKTPN